MRGDDATPPDLFDHCLGSTIACLLTVITVTPTVAFSRMQYVRQAGTACFFSFSFSSPMQCSRKCKKGNGQGNKAGTCKCHGKKCFHYFLKFLILLFLFRVSFHCFEPFLPQRETEDLR